MGILEDINREFVLVYLSIVPPFLSVGLLRDFLVLCPSLFLLVDRAFPPSLELYPWLLPMMPPWFLLLFVNRSFLPCVHRSFPDYSSPSLLRPVFVCFCYLVQYCG